MNLPFFIARKYFFSRKISNVIHVISSISMLGIMVGSAALVIVLSAFNGFEEVVGKLYSSFDSDIKIVPASGKYFVPDINKIHQIEKLGGIKAITPVIEENALLKYKTNQITCTIKAIDPEYISTTGVDSAIIPGTGNDEMYADSTSYAILGGGVANKLDVRGVDEMNPIQVYVPRKGVEFSMLNPENSLSEKNILAGGVFSIQQDFDTRYVLAPIQFARELMDDKKDVTALELNLKDRKNLSKTRDQVQDIMGSNFQVLDRFQQQSSIFKIMRVEKSITFMVLCLILLIATFNLIGALLMLAIEKQKDMAILLSMGAAPSTIQRIITFEGLILSLGGAVIGITIGAIVCWLQMQFGFVKLGGEGSTFVINAYPVAFQPLDFLMIFATVLILGYLASWFPARMANKKIGVAALSSRE